MVRKPELGGQRTVRAGSKAIKAPQNKSNAQDANVRRHSQQCNNINHTIQLTTLERKMKRKVKFICPASVYRLLQCCAWMPLCHHHHHHSSIKISFAYVKRFGCSLLPIFLPSVCGCSIYNHNAPFLHHLHPPPSPLSWHTKGNRAIYKFISRSNLCIYRHICM